jgi:hypothetical protein
MSEKNINLESSLQQLEFARPSENYLSRRMNITRQNNNSHPNWNTRIAALLLSVG